jgi:hypothetical protein
MAQNRDYTQTEEHRTDATGGLAYCVNHPNVETRLRCNRCGDPICVRCAVHTPVGYRCPKCVREQQSAFYTGLPVDNFVAAVISIPVAAAGAFLTSLLGFWFLAIFIGPAAGALVSDLAWRAVGRRRGRYLWVVVCGSIILGTLVVAIARAGGFSGRTITLSLFGQLPFIIYVVLAASAAYGRLRLA